MTGVRNIIFDFDGTLADTAPLIIATMQAANRALGLPERTDAQCRAMIARHAVARIARYVCRVCADIPQALRRAEGRLSRRVF